MSNQQADDQSNSVDWMEIFNTVTNFVLLNMLWLFSALLIVTIPAVTAALFAAVAPWARGKSVYRPFTAFWTGIKAYWLKATVVMLIDVAGIALVVANFLILNQMDLQQILPIVALMATMLLLLLLILCNVYFWPLLVTFDQPLRDLLKNTFKLAITHPLWGLLIAAAATVPLALTLFLPRLFLLTITFAATALITEWGAWRIIRRYINEQKIQNLGV